MDATSPFEFEHRLTAWPHDLEWPRCRSSARQLAALERMESVHDHTGRAETVETLPLSSTWTMSP